MGKNKAKFVKRAVRKDTLKIKKGGYHKEKKGDAKEMRKDEKKDIEERLDESSVTAGIKGYLSNMRQSPSSGAGVRRKGAPAWYLDKKSHLAHSLQESIERLAFRNLILEVVDDEEERARLMKKFAPGPGQIPPGKRDVPFKGWGKDSPVYRAKMAKPEKTAKRPYGGGRLMGTEEEVEEFERAKEGVKEKRRKPRHRRGLAGRGISAKAHGLGTKANKILDGYLGRLSQKAMRSRMAGLESSYEEKAHEFLQKMTEESPLFWKSHLTSYPLHKSRDSQEPGMLSHVEEWAEERGLTPFDVKMGPGSDSVIHLAAEGVPVKLLMQFALYYKNNKEEVTRAEIALKTAITKASRRGLRGDTVGSIEDVGLEKEIRKGEEKAQEDQAALSKEMEEEGLGQFEDYFKQVEMPSDDALNPEQLDPVRPRMSPGLEKNLENIYQKLAASGRDFSQISTEDIEKLVPQKDMRELVSNVVLDPKGLYRQQAVRAISKKFGFRDEEGDINTDLVKKALEDMIQTNPDGSKVVRNPRTVIKRRLHSDSPEEVEKMKPVLSMIRKVFDPREVIRAKRTAVTAGSPILDYVKDKLREIERSKLAPEISSARKQAFEKRRKEKEEIRKTPPQPLETEIEDPDAPGGKRRERVKTPRVRRFADDKSTKFSPHDPFNKKKKMEELEGLEALREKHRAAKAGKSPAALSDKLSKLLQMRAELSNDLGSLPTRGGQYSTKKKARLKDKLETLNDKIRQLQRAVGEEEGITTTESLKRHLKKKLFEEFDLETFSIVEMLMSPENSMKEKKVEKKVKPWEKAKPEKAKSFYPTLEEVLLGDRK